MVGKEIRKDDIERWEVLSGTENPLVESSDMVGQIMSHPLSRVDMVADDDVSSVRFIPRRIWPNVNNRRTTVASMKTFDSDGPGA